MEDIEEMSLDEQVSQILFLFTKLPVDRLKKPSKEKMRETRDNIIYYLSSMGADRVQKKVLMYLHFYKYLSKETLEYAPGPYAFFDPESSNDIHVTSSRRKMESLVDPFSAFGKSTKEKTEKGLEALQKKRKDLAHKKKFEEMKERYDHLWVTLEDPFCGGKSELVVRWCISSSLRKAFLSGKTLDPDKLRSLLWRQLKGVSEDFDSLVEILSQYGLGKELNAEELESIWEFYYMGPCWKPD